ncbi:MAG TPA: AAA family ATPase [Pirellulaceae bacterium]|nr:AAA family ATPase [Pirellulaceae bacterium]
MNLPLSPFASGLDARRFFASATHEEALARLEYLLEKRSRLGLLTGPSGSGKSLLLELTARRWKRAGHAVAVLDVVGRSTHDFLWQLASQWQCPVLPNAPTFALWQAITDALTVQRCEHRAAALLIDDADFASRELCELLQRLVHLGDAQQPRLTMVLAVAERRGEDLGPRLLERAELRIELQPWDVAETRDYLQLQLADQTTTAPTLDMPATQRLHDLCAGLPRRINQLANLVLLAAASEAQEVVDVETIEKVYRELTVR